MVQDTSSEIRIRLGRGEPVDLRPTPGTRVKAKDGQSWDAARQIDASMLIRLLIMPVGADGWTHRPLHLAGARVAGSLDLEAATLTRPVYLEDCFLEEPFILNGAQAITIRLTGCHLPGIDGQELQTRGDLRLNSGLRVTGEVNLVGAHIGGTLNCDCGSFQNRGMTALDVQRLVVEESMWMEHATVNGEVNMRNAHIGAQLNLNHGTFINPERRDGEERQGGIAIRADYLVVGGSMYCADKFKATGEVRLGGARIGGQLFCSNGKFTNRGGTSLDADYLVVDGSMYCANGFEATGEVRLGGARIGGPLVCSKGKFISPGKTAINLEHAVVAREIVFRPARLEGAIVLSYAQAGAWYDSESTWPEDGELHFIGFSYKAIDAEPSIKVARRLDWLRREASGFSPQPYAQLASVYIRDGNEHDARKVQISGQWRRRSAVNNWTDRALRPFRVAWSAVLWAFVGYGYRPWQILAPIGLLFLFGCWWFPRAQRDGEILRTKDLNPDVQFNGARYTADLLIPGASLGERARFLPIEDTAWWTTGYTLAGWALAAMLIAGLTGVFRRQ